MAKTPDGVRGPGGPPRPQPDKRASAPRTKAAPGTPRAELERRSYPLVMALTRVPRWLVVVVMALCLFFGLIQSGSLAWLGGVLLTIVSIFLGWLLVLSWPVIGMGSRLIRLVTVLAVLGIAVLKFMGRF